MSAIDVEDLLEPVSSEEPCGEDLEYDPAYIEMEQLAQGKPEQQFGDTVIEAEEPQWNEVRKRAAQLLKRSKDLRIAAMLARACLHTDGIEGLRDGTVLLQGLVERYWDELHPQLDPEDDYDPTMRVNAVAVLCDPGSMLRYVREAPLASSRGLGQVNLRDLDIVAGRASAPADAAEPPPDSAALEAIFMDCPVEELQTTAAQVDQIIGAVQSLEGQLTERLGASQAPDLSALPHLLQTARHELAERLARRGVGEAPAEESAEPAAADTATPAAGGAVQVPRGEIGSRDDVVRMLDKLCQYFERHEPSSPVPLLLKRAKRLVHMDFLEIMQNMAPDGMPQVEMIRGPEEGQAAGEDGY